MVLLTSEETTANSGNDDLNSKQRAHACENLLVLVINSVNTDNMDHGADCEEDGGADGFEEEELLAPLLLCCIEKNTVFLRSSY